MATVQVTRCDVCGSDKQVDKLVVVYHYRKGRPWEVDICASCYEDRFGDVIKKGRRPEINNVRPQHKFKKIAITEDNL